MRTYRFTVPGPPVGKQRPKFSTRVGSKFVHVYTPDKTVAYEKLIRDTAAAIIEEPMEYVDLILYIIIPPRVVERKTMPDKLLEPKLRPDVDNVLKAVMDALEGVAYHNDKNVLSTSANLVCMEGYKPRIDISINERKFIIHETRSKNNDDT